MENLNRFLEKMQDLFSLKKVKVTLYIVAVLWLAVVVQIVMNRFLYEDIELSQAFVNTKSSELKSKIEVIADYNKGFLSEFEKKEIIQHIADGIGLTIDREISVIREGTRTEYSFEKQARNALSQIKVISLEQEEDSTVKIKHYLVVRLTIENSIQSIDRYRKILEERLSELEIDRPQITLQYEGSFPGYIDSEERDRMASILIEELQGRTVLEHEEGNSYTVYAYTGLINEYIVSLGNPVNIQIAVTYDEEKDKTKFYLATPILNQSW